MKCYIGIDPGSASGCIAIIYWDEKTQIEYDTIEFAKHTTKEWFSKLKEVKSKGYLDTLRPPECIAFLEKVHTMPKQGVVSAGTFMRNVGQIEMALIALDIPFKEITPQTWMKHYNLKKEKDESKVEWKRRLRERLQRIMPEFKVNNSNADAMLIAYYAAINF